MRPRVRALALLLASLGAGAGLAHAADDAAFKELDAEYRKLARNKDDAANRDRRKLILRTFDFRDLKPCRKLLRDAVGGEPTSEGKVAAVQVLGACGDTKELDWLVTQLKKERVEGPVIALAQGLSYTAPDAAPVVAAWAVGAAAKQKGELQRALLEGVAEIGDPAAFAALKPLAGKVPPDTEFERLIALGTTGRDGARGALDTFTLSSDAQVRLAAALGLARSGGPEQPPSAESVPALLALAADTDARVVDVVAAALGRAKHAPAVKPLAEALPRAPLRVRETIRQALKEITGRDAGHDAAAWLAADGKADPPKFPRVLGIDVPTDSVAVILDLSRSMQWNDRLAAAQRVLSEFVDTLSDDAVFGVLAAARTPVPMSDKLSAGAAARTEAQEWIAKQLTAGGCDLREALHYVPRQWPAVDTIVLATDSAPWGDSAEDGPFEVLQQFRRENRHHRLRVFVVFVAPGGRYEAGETDADEYSDRKDILRQFAESTGGKFLTLE